MLWDINSERAYYRSAIGAFHVMDQAQLIIAGVVLGSEPRRDRQLYK